MKYCPDLSLMAVAPGFTDCCRTVTVAPAIAAPLGSVIVPAIADCAAAERREPWPARGAGGGAVGRNAGGGAVANESLGLAKTCAETGCGTDGRRCGMRRWLPCCARCRNMRSFNRFHHGWGSRHLRFLRRLRAGHRHRRPGRVRRGLIRQIQRDRKDCYSRRGRGNENRIGFSQRFHQATGSAMGTGSGSAASGSCAR